MQVKTGQDLPREGADSALDEVLGSYKAELGLSDTEAEQLDHLQVSLPAQHCCQHCNLLILKWHWSNLEFQWL